MPHATQGISKNDAILEIERQIEEGRGFLSLAIHTHDDMVMANARRSGWALRNRKLFYTLFSDSSMLARQFPPVALDQALPAHPALAQEVVRFRQSVVDHLACMAKVVGFLRKLA